METHNFIEQVIRPMYNGLPSIDGLLHVETVVHMGRTISAVECKGYEDDAIVGCWLHDIGRTVKSGTDHGLDGYSLARQLLQEYSVKLSHPERVLFGIRYHNKGFVTDDPLVGSIWDADRLTFSRLGKPVDKSFLSTTTSQLLVDYAAKYISQFQWK